MNRPVVHGCFSVWLVARAPAERYSDVHGIAGQKKKFLWPRPDALGLPPRHLAVDRACEDHQVE
eukprot:11196226-Lingulodinium_polyedra.AAC.1